MTETLVRLFVKNSRDTTDPAVRTAYGNLASWVGIFCNLLLCAGKFLAGTLSGSISIAADAVNNLSDASSSVVSLIGFKLGARPADDEHPYGHARFEYLAGLAVAVMVLVIGVELLKSSVDKILHPAAVTFSWVAMAVLAASIAVKLWMSLFNRTLGKRINSGSLIATAADSRNDVFSTVAILIGMGITWLTSYNLDGWMGLIVALLIVVGGVQLIMETSNPLLGVAPTEELVQGIYQKILSYDGVLGLHDLNVHNYGPGRCFASVHCEVPAEQDILVSHDIIDNIERDFLRDMNIHLVIHLDPVVTDDERTTKLKQQVEQILNGLSDQISMHDFRVVWGTTHTNVIFDVCVPFGFQWSDTELIQRISEQIANLNATYFAVLTVDHDYVPRIAEKTKE